MKEKETTLWYQTPAAHWEEALPLGNGRIGAMAWSGAAEDTLSLNEDTLWSGYPRDTNVPGALEHYRTAQNLALQGRLPEAQRHLEKHFLGGFTEGYLPLGELRLIFPGIRDREARDYLRSLDLTRAVAETSFTQGGVAYRREVFVSHPAQVLVLRLSADRPGALNFSLSLDSRLRHQVAAEGARLTMTGICPSHVEPAYVDCENPVVYEAEDHRKGMSFCAAVTVDAPGGVVTPGDGALSVAGADSAVLIFAARTSFAGFDRHPHLEGRDAAALCRADLEAAAGSAWDELLAAHVADYRSYFDRVALSFGPGRTDLPTDERLRRPQKGDDTGLYALLFHYGRYLLIASSRGGTQAANLQGIWSRELRPPWSSNYTVNINTQMNYWPAESCNLSELHEPLFDLLGALSVTGGKTARCHYGAGGFVGHHNIDIWAHASPVGHVGEHTATYAFWPLSAGWLCRHLMDHYSFTMDREFLERTAWPLLRGAARFFLDVLTPDTRGYLVFCPSTSPENSFLLKGEICAVSATATMTTAIIREVLGYVLQCCDILGTDPGLRGEAAAALEQLPPYRVGCRGQLQEWDEDYPEAEPAHRHSSHLYPLYPGHDIHPEQTPELAEACRRSLVLRGDEGTGWALAWRVNLWARLGEGNRALRLLTNQLRLVRPNTREGAGGSYPNLFGAHPPFQIDSNFGATAGISELLLQSTRDSLHLLPALPDALGSGGVAGLRARGGYEADIVFKGGALISAVIRKTSPGAAETAVRYGACTLRRTMAQGEELRLNAADFATAAV